MLIEREKPNILITGTPGTGKSTLAKSLASSLSFLHIDVSKLSIKNNWLLSFDEEFDSYVLDEDKCLDSLEELLRPGGAVVDYHSCELFPERWFDLVVVLRCSTEQLYDRLKTRGYSKRKLLNNQECEIMQVLIEEAKACYKSEIIMELSNSTEKELSENFKSIKAWVDAWKI